MSNSNQMLEELSWARGFAKAFAHRLPSYLDRDDLQSAAIVAYLGAAERYDVSKGASFRGYCATRIRGAILDEIRRWGWASRSACHNQRLMEASADNLRGSLNREPTSAELGEQMGISSDAVLDIQHKAETRQMISWDELAENIHGEKGFNLAEATADQNAARPDAALLSDDDRRVLLSCLAKLPQMQALVVVLHYMKDIQLSDVAKLTGLTPSRISQIHHKALSRLKLLCQHQF